jgi:hypothetical protein
LLPLGQRRKGLFNVNASDYLYRGGEERGLEARLRCYLRGEVFWNDDSAPRLQQLTSDRVFRMKPGLLHTL